MSEDNIHKRREEIPFTEERRYLRCPRVEHLTLGEDAAEMEKLKIRNGGLARGTVGGVVGKVVTVVIKMEVDKL